MFRQFRRLILTRLLAVFRASRIVRTQLNRQPPVVEVVNPLATRVALAGLLVSLRARMVMVPVLGAPPRRLRLLGVLAVRRRLPRPLRQLAGLKVNQRVRPTLFAVGLVSQLAAMVMVRPVLGLLALVVG